MGRHRHALNVRVDGLAPVLGRLLDDTRIRSAALVDVESGVVLDACGPVRPGSDRAGELPDPEVQSAGHADLARVTLAVLRGAAGGHPGRCEVVVDDGAGRHHVVRVLPDGHGGPLALAVVVAGPERVVARVRRRLRRVSAAALTAGPSAVRRPPARSAGTGNGTPAGVRDLTPAAVRDLTPNCVPAGPSVAGRGPAPPSALPPGRGRA